MAKDPKIARKYIHLVDGSTNYIDVNLQAISQVNFLMEPVAGVLRGMR